MIQQLLIYLPCTAGLFWVLTYIVKAFSDKRYLYLLAFMALSVVYIYTDATYFSSFSTAKELLLALFMGQFITPCVIPLFIIYLNTCIDPAKNHTESLIWVFIPLILGALEASIAYAVGIDSVYDFAKEYVTTGVYPEAYDTMLYKVLYILAIFGFHFLTAAETVYLLFYLLIKSFNGHFKPDQIIGFYTEGKSITPAQYQITNAIFFAVFIIIKEAITREYAITHQNVIVLINIGMSIVLYFIGLAGLRSYMPSIKLKSFWHEEYSDDSSEE